MMNENFINIPEYDNIMELMNEINKMKFNKYLDTNAFINNFQKLMMLMRWKKNLLPFTKYGPYDPLYIPSEPLSYLYIINYRHLTTNKKKRKEYKNELKKICSKVIKYMKNYKALIIFNYEFIVNYPY